MERSMVLMCRKHKFSTVILSEAKDLCICSQRWNAPLLRLAQDDSCYLMDNPICVPILSDATSTHVEQTQPRHAAALQQSLMHILLVQLFNLRGRHVPPVGIEIAIRF